MFVNKPFDIDFRHVIYFLTSEYAVELVQSLVQEVLVALVPGLNRLECEFVQLSPSTA